MSNNISPVKHKGSLLCRILSKSCFTRRHSIEMNKFKNIKTNTILILARGIDVGDSFVKNKHSKNLYKIAVGGAFVPKKIDQTHSRLFDGIFGIHVRYKLLCVHMMRKKTQLVQENNYAKIPFI